MRILAYGRRYPLIQESEVTTLLTPESTGHLQLKPIPNSPITLPRGLAHVYGQLAQFAGNDRRN